MMIYTIDKADKTREPTRQLTINFFKNELGFKDENIIIVDRNEFIGTPGEESTKFSSETKETMKNLARLLIGDTKYGLANQILHIALCEC